MTDNSAETARELAPHDRRALQIIKLASEQAEELTALRYTAATVSRDREAIARIIDPRSFEMDAEYSNNFTRNAIEQALTKADAILSLTPRGSGAEAMREALEPFVRHYEAWMDDHSDDVNCGTFSRHTFGELRRAKHLHDTLLTAAPSGTVTIYIPSGYTSAKEFLSDCGFEAALAALPVPGKQGDQSNG